MGVMRDELYALYGDICHMYLGSVDHGGCGRRDAAHALHKVERHTLCSEDGPCVAMQPANNRDRGYTVAVAGVPGDVQGGVDEVKHDVGDGEAGEDAGGLGDKGGSGRAGLGDTDIRRWVCAVLLCVCVRGEGGEVAQHASILVECGLHRSSEVIGRMGRGGDWRVAWWSAMRW